MTESTETYLALVEAKFGTPMPALDFICRQCGDTFGMHMGHQCPEHNFIETYEFAEDYGEQDIEPYSSEAKPEEPTAIRGDKNKHDGGKLMWDILTWDAVEEVVRVLTFGAERYGAYSWKNVDDARNRYMAAMMRHIKVWYAGEEIDPDSGIHHLAHAGCNLMFLLQGYIEDLPEFLLEDKQ